MTGVDLLADEHVNRAFVLALRANGYDVAVVHDDYPPGIDDDSILDRALRDDRVILTNDDDFASLALRKDHAGVIMYDDQGNRPADVVRGITRIDRHLDRAELHDHVEWLENWL